MSEFTGQDWFAYGFIFGVLATLLLQAIKDFLK